MEVEVIDAELRRLAEDTSFVGSWDMAIAKAYRRKLQQIAAAKDERDLRFPGGNHFEKLRPPRSHQHSMRLNDQWRLILELRSEADGTIARVVAIEDYH